MSSQPSTMLHERPATSAPSNRLDSVTRLATAPHAPSNYERFAKPAIDIAGAAVLLILFAPIMIAVAIAVRVNLGKGVLYRQTRVGRNGELFTMLKFRSMVHDRRGPRGTAADRKPAAETDDVASVTFIGGDRRRTHKHPNDPRVTPVGAFIRRFSLDELPQLINVLRGELSIIGPRPELATIVEGYDDWQHRRHDVKPGLTGLWQVTERDREGRMHLCVETDLTYIRDMSLRADLKILAMTPAAVLGIEPRGTTSAA